MQSQSCKCWLHSTIVEVSRDLILSKSFVHGRSVQCSVQIRHLHVFPAHISMCVGRKRRPDEPATTPLALLEALQSLYPTRSSSFRTVDIRVGYNKCVAWCSLVNVLLTHSSTLPLNRRVSHTTYVFPVWSNVNDFTDFTVVRSRYNDRVRPLYYIFYTLSSMHDSVVCICSKSAFRE